MKCILFIILIFTTTTFPFPDSATSLTLISQNSSKDIPPRHPCSCQLLSFSIYQNFYILRVHTDLDSYNWTAIKIRSSSECLIGQLDSTKTVEMIINETRYGNGNELTQSYWIDFFTSESKEPQYNCSMIQDRGEERIVYLLNRTKSDVQGQYSYIINLPKYSIGLTQALSFLLLCLLSHNIKYRRFMPIQFNFIFAFLYSIFLFATIYIDSFVQEILDISFWIAIIFSMVCTFLYFFDLTSACFNQKSVFFGISLFLMIVLGLSDLVILPDGWPINNIIAVLVAGTLIKFVVIKKLKSSILPLIFLWLFFVFRQFIVLFHVQNFQQALHIKVVPLFLQLPGLFGDDEIGFLCSAFGTSKIITMGLIINYCVRVDLFLSTRFYTLLSTIIALACLFLEYLILIIADDLPVLEYTSVIIFLPVSFLLILLLSSKRGEWAELWHGSFHDIAIDRKSIKRESESILDDDELDRNLQKLKMNPSLLTN